MLFAKIGMVREIKFFPNRGVKIMKKIMGAIALLFLLAGCSSANLELSDLKEDYPKTFANPIEDLSEEKQNKMFGKAEIKPQITGKKCQEDCKEECVDEGIKQDLFLKRVS